MSWSLAEARQAEWEADNLDYLEALCLGCGKEEERRVDLEDGEAYDPCACGSYEIERLS